LAHERSAIEERAAAARRRPLLAAPEVVEVAELDVAHRRPFRDRDREAEVRDAPLRVERAVDWVEHDPRRPAAPERLLAELLGDEEEIAARRGQPVDDHLLGGGVDRGRLVAALALADDRLARGPALQFSEHAPHVLRGGAARLEPRARRGWNRSPAPRSG